MARKIRRVKDHDEKPTSCTCFLGHPPCSYCTSMTEEEFEAEEKKRFEERKYLEESQKDNTF